MRKSKKIKTSFWDVSQTGRKIIEAGPETGLVALYLLSSPHSNLIGLYHLPYSYISIDTRLPMEKVTEAMDTILDCGFAEYDFEREIVWVIEMAFMQNGKKVSSTQRVGIEKILQELPKTELVESFKRKYKCYFNDI